MTFCRGPQSGGGIPLPRPKPSPFQGEGAPKGRMRVGLVGCGGHRTGGWGHPPLHRVTIDFVGAAVLSGPSITAAPPWSPSSVTAAQSLAALLPYECGVPLAGACAHATFSPAGGEGYSRSVGSAQMSMAFPSSVTANAMPPSPRGRRKSFLPRRGRKTPSGLA